MSIVEIKVNRPERPAWLHNPFAYDSRGEELVAILSDMSADEARATYESYDNSDKEAVLSFYKARDNRDILKRTLLGGGIIATVGGVLWFLNSDSEDEEDEDDEEVDDEFDDEDKDVETETE